jgi:hypothetical protein
VKADGGYRFRNVWTVPTRTRLLMNPLSVFEGAAEMQETPEERESRMRHLAQKLMFTVEKTNGRYTLIRTADVSRPVHEANLTLKEAEDLLATWKLRGQG